MMMDTGPQNPLAALDFYRTLPSDLTARSKSGGLISVGTMVVIFMLLWAEIGHFFAERKYSTIMVERVTGHDKIGLNINMTIQDYGCHSIYLKYRTRTKGYLIDHVDQSHLRFHDENGGCVITGDTSIVKVPGFLEIALRKSGSKEVAIPHNIDHIYIGDNIFDDDEAVWHEDIPEIVFNPLREHDESDVEVGMDTEYHLQLVHTALHLDRSGKAADPYQYSYSTKHKQNKSGYPSIKIFFDWSPITIKYGIKSYHYSDLGGRLIATIGGCFTIAMFVHTFLISTTQSVIQRVSPVSSTKLGA